jgi:hypothetical protein
MQCISSLQTGLFRAYALRITGVAGEHQLVNIKQYSIASNSPRLKMAILAYNPIMQQRFEQSSVRHPAHVTIRQSLSVETQYKTFHTASRCHDL